MRSYRKDSKQVRRPERALMAQSWSGIRRVSNSTIVKRWLSLLLGPRPFLGIIFLPRFFIEWRKYAAIAHDEDVSARELYPCLTDRTLRTPFDPHYFYQGAWIARCLVRDRPDFHVDIGSSVLTLSVLSGMVETVFVDYRPVATRLSGFSSLAADIIHLPFATGSIKSISCLHVIEHIGLGRYGDTLDPEGSSKAASELLRVLKPGGRLYLSVPIGRARVCFNAHRVFDPETIKRYFSALRLLEFSFVDDEGQFREYQDASVAARCEYGCGMFVFEKTRQ
jgi:hypothetical protein